MENTDHQDIELATFHVGDALCGMNILEVQEINRHVTMTTVPQGPSYVLGVINLRGRIVTVIDLGAKMGLTPITLSSAARNIIVRADGEYVGFLVDRISDVVHAQLVDIEPPPANIGGIQGRYFNGVLKTEKTLIGVLDTEAILKGESD